MRNLNKFITGTDYLAYVNNGNVVAVEYENVIVKVTRDSVNEYEVTFIRNDRTYSYKCHTQKEVIESIKNDIAYHDSAAKETANENEFAEFEKSLNETEEFKEVISARNAHMSMNFKDLKDEFYVGAYNFTKSGNAEYSIYFLGEYNGSIKVINENLAEHYRAYDEKTVEINDLDRFF